jgi:hypothetical protein
MNRKNLFTFQNLSTFQGAIKIINSSKKTDDRGFIVDFQEKNLYKERV